jgi:predicted AAA+ superfamily ATPase
VEREVMGKLRAWKSSARRKPLLLEGPRQVGKTWLLEEFGSEAYRDTAYLDFEETPSLRTIFNGDFDASRIVSQLQVATNTRIEPGHTLIVLDEIQACPEALTTLKYFHDRAPEYHIACAGSLLGVALHENSPFPVGKVNFIPVNPLSFTEFLHAVGQETLAKALADPDWGLLAPFHDRLVDVLRDYLFIGGMPEAVAAFAETRDYAGARVIQQEILLAYDRDFSKHAPTDQVPRIRGVWQSVPGQLAKEQHRFAYGQLAPGARARMYQTAIEWLVQAGVVLEVTRVSAPRMPLSGYIDRTAFKLYLADVGLLGALAGLGVSTVIEGNRLFTEFRGSLTEQYAAMALFAAFGAVPHYWTNGGGTAEVDFIVQRDRDVVPVEVKASRNLKSQSLRVYQGKYSPELSVRASLAPYSRQENLIDLPLYALSSLPALHNR